ncbi:MAG TPA: hypothetical protein VN753_01450 [Terracidiphilus sp.]|nr:hypothetical protein [Terracidiphilus sp.]
MASDRFNHFESRLNFWESDSTLLDRSSFPRRMEILDAIDAFLSGFNLADSAPISDLVNRAHAYSAKINRLNDYFFASMRREIKAGIAPSELQRRVQQFASAPPCGIAYDDLDDIIAGVLQFEPPSEEPRPLGAESVFYQPTPARHIFHLFTAAAVTQADTLIDLGSGLGHLPLLASICTGASAIGIELDPAWVVSATKCATALNLSSVSFLAQNALNADLSSGTVFYLYTPFTGTTLASVLESLREQSTLRPIRICTFGPCAISVTHQSWLKPLTEPATDQITIFLPRT